MSHKMKVRKGDLVHMLSGKDRGKEGRVIDARPRDFKVMVETTVPLRRSTMAMAFLAGTFTYSECPLPSRAKASGCPGSLMSASLRE